MVLENPISGGGLIQLGALALAGVVTDQLAQQGLFPDAIQRIFHDLSKERYPVVKQPAGGKRPGAAVPPPPGPRGEPPAGGYTGQDPQCLAHIPWRGMTFEVVPHDPPREAGARVTYRGYLFESEDGIGAYAGHRVEFWDPAWCQPFAAAETDEHGYYEHTRPLQEDELEGYQVFAHFPGARGGSFPFVWEYEADRTGIWNVVPQ